VIDSYDELEQGNLELATCENSFQLLVLCNRCKAERKTGVSDKLAECKPRAGSSQALQFAVKTSASPYIISIETVLGIVPLVMRLWASNAFNFGLLQTTFRGSWCFARDTSTWK